MRIDAVFGPGAATPAVVTGRAVVVIDVLRASTTIATALHHGARFVVPLESADEVITRSKQLDRRTRNYGLKRLPGQTKSGSGSLQSAESEWNLPPPSFLPDFRRERSPIPFLCIPQGIRDSGHADSIGPTSWIHHIPMARGSNCSCARPSAI